MNGEPCEFCGFVFDQDKLGRYGCPNCEGSPIDGVAVVQDQTFRASDGDGAAR